MRKELILMALLLLTTGCLIAQEVTPEKLGYKYIPFTYRNDSVDILIKSKKGEENIAKPLFFFCQGSLPYPLIKYNSKNDFAYPVFPFDTDSIENDFHLVIVSKPYIPLVADVSNLRNMRYLDERAPLNPKKYSDRNLLSYYVPRNIEIIKYLLRQPWVSDKKVVVAGHSEGSTIAAKMSSQLPLITHLIYASGNPMGRIMSIIARGRAAQSYNNDSETDVGQSDWDYWKSVVENKNSMDDSRGDTPRATYEFSEPCYQDIEALDIPVLISYGTKDRCTPYIDYLQVDLIRKGKKNFRFDAYIGTEHNFFPVDEDNKPNYEIDNWNKVASDWLRWLNKN
ncbi:alpha/beta hydrolase [Dysgonomonas sp. OttesenSCG-928-M03]|nr:alpha/beta hydrolase [Dysgonomonas sp. OttesenSCG-928-M03]